MAVGAIVAGVVAVSRHAVIILVGPRVTVGALVVVVVQISWGTWGIFCSERRNRAKLAISSSTDNRNTQKNAIAKAHRVGLVVPFLDRW